LRDIHDGAIRHDDEEVKEDFRRDYERGEEVDWDGDYGQEGMIEERKEDGVEESDDMRKS